jgi:cation diffusion facilitator CzcD-associated flavoprotein CzcO
MKPHEFSTPPQGTAATGVETARVIVIGTGFSGLCMGVKLREAGESSFIMLERASDVGGTWRDNNYPGCGCDVPSHLYSFSFESNPNWSRMYAPQPEIYDYLRGCAKKYDLLKHVRFNTNVVQARFDEARKVWHLSSEDGRQFEADGRLEQPHGAQHPGPGPIRG